MEMKVIRSGQLTTVQDLGRRGYRAAGVPLCGAMDPFALRVANSLAGNPESTAVLEFTLVGPELEFTADAVVALGGADTERLPAWKPLKVAAGERLVLGECIGGCRGYLAVAGGIEVPQVLGSRSTYLRAGFGGWLGRALRDGDVLPIERRAAPEPDATPARVHAGPAAWRIDPRILPAYSSAATVRVLGGTHQEEFGRVLFESEFTVSPQSDRMGLRLLGARIDRSNSDELLSSAVMPGTIQVPPDGQPLVLMADAQTIGGYPQLAHVIGVDLPVMAQLRPGDRVRFTETTLEEAQRLAIVRERALAILREGLAEKRATGTLP